MKKSSLCVFSILSVGYAFSAGFSLYEGSAYGNAMGGAVVGKAHDASANFYNPATLTDMTGTVITVGMTTEHPTADTYVNGKGNIKMNPGCFILPHVYLAQELPYDFAFGLGLAPEYGLGTHYKKNWKLAWDTRDTTIEGLTFNPNLAYKVTEKWSVAAGFRLMYLSFDQHSDQQAVKDGVQYGSVRDHLKGDNGMTDWGWELSTKYDVTEKFSVGAMYKSFIDCKVKGFNHARVSKYDDSAIAPQVQKGVQAAMAPYAQLVSLGMLSQEAYDQAYNQAYGQAYGSAVSKAHQTVDEGAASANGSAAAKIRLPQSVTLGANYDLTDDLHLGVAGTWTQWSSVERINFQLPGDHDKTLDLKWNDAWRIGFGAAYDLTDDLMIMASYVYDMDPCRKYYGTTMLPPGDRHIGTIGLGYTWGPVVFDLSYGLVFMTGDSLRLTDGTGENYKFETKNGLSHAVAVTMSYSF